MEYRIRLSRMEASLFETSGKRGTTASPSARRTLTLPRDFPPFRSIQPWPISQVETEQPQELLLDGAATRTEEGNQLSVARLGLAVTQLEKPGLERCLIWSTIS